MNLNAMHPEIASKSLRQKRILVVDDDDAVREALGRILRETGYEVALAATGPEAIAQFQSGIADLVLLDLNLPDQSGWDLFEHLTTRHPWVPVIVITGMSGQFPVARAAGVGALFEKPVEVPALLITIERLLAEPGELRLLRLCGRLEDTRYLPPARMLAREERRRWRGSPAPAHPPKQKVMR